MSSDRAQSVLEAVSDDEDDWEEVEVSGQHRHFEITLQADSTKSKTDDAAKFVYQH